MNVFFRVCAVLVTLLVSMTVQAQTKPHKPIPVRVVIVTTFELGEDTGDVPGEFQAWVERFPLKRPVEILVITPGEQPFVRTH